MEVFDKIIMGKEVGSRKARSWKLEVEFGKMKMGSWKSKSNVFSIDFLFLLGSMKNNLYGLCKSLDSSNL